ncbi:hypothetical protein ACFYNO_24355 [Kitasatospora sp. NPDC006697]|uniref:hypothetical protein n=1 Tax=Kitasatospora sp. NPDC006697 TaxID=3364020 RepID=UPI0036CCDB12
MNVHLHRHLTPHRISAEQALSRFRIALSMDGLILPSLGLDAPSLVTGQVLIELGRARPETVRRISDLLIAGIAVADR